MRTIAEQTVQVPVTIRLELHERTPLTRDEVTEHFHRGNERDAIRAILEPAEAFASALRTRLIQLGQRPWAYPPVKPVEGK